jgi:hypothetical protein
VATGNARSTIADINRTFRQRTAAPRPPGRPVTCVVYPKVASHVRLHADVRAVAVRVPGPRSPRPAGISKIEVTLDSLFVSLFFAACLLFLNDSRRTA